MTSSLWQDWHTGSGFQIRFSPRAREVLVGLPAAVQFRLRSRLAELADLAALVPFNTEADWNWSTRPTLQINEGEVLVRYSISEEQRTLQIDAVLPVESSDSLGQIA